MVGWLSSAKLKDKSFMKKIKSIIEIGSPWLTTLYEAKTFDNAHSCMELYIAFRAPTIVELQPSRSNLYHNDFLSTSNAFWYSTNVQKSFSLLLRGFAINE